MSPDEVVRIPRRHATVRVPVAADMLGLTRSPAYRAAQTHGHIAGVPVIRVGRTLRVPTAPILERLGLSVDTEATA